MAGLGKWPMVFIERLLSELLAELVGAAGEAASFPRP